MGRSDGQPQTQDPRGLRTMPPRHPRRAYQSHHPEIAHRRAGCGESPPVRFGKGPPEKDPNHGHLADGLLHTDPERVQTALAERGVHVDLRSFLTLDTDYRAA